MTRVCTVILTFSIIIFGFQAPGISQDAPPAPSLLYASFINAMEIQERTGEISFTEFWAIFLPEIETDDYHMFAPDGDAELWAIISDSGEESIARLDFYVLQSDSPYFLATHYSGTDYRTGDDNVVRFALDEGDYSMDFYLDGEPFFHFPFSIDVLPSTDTYSPDDYYFLEGGWADWSYFIYPDADPEEPLQWKVWLRNKAGEEYWNYEVLAELKRDGGGVIATGREGVSYNLRPGWLRCEFDLVMPGDKGLFRGKHLLGNDGSYTLTLKLNGDLYGTWKFQVADGEFVYEGSADRSITDPVDFIEGGPDVFFYERQ